MSPPESARIQEASSRTTGQDHGWTLGGSAGWYWQTDSRLRLNYVFGAPSGHLPLGLRPWELPGVDIHHPEWARQLDALILRRAFENVLWRRIDGSWVWREYLVSGEPMFGPKGRFKGFRGVGHQISESLSGLRDTAAQLEDLVCTLAVQTGRAIEVSAQTPAASPVRPLLADMEQAVQRAIVICKRFDASLRQTSTSP